MGESGICDGSTLGKRVFIPTSGSGWELKGYSDIDDDGGATEGAAGASAALSDDKLQLTWQGGTQCGCEETVEDVAVTTYTCLGSATCGDKVKCYHILPLGQPRVTRNLNLFTKLLP